MDWGWRGEVEEGRLNYGEAMAFERFDCVGAGFKGWGVREGSRGDADGVFQGGKGVERVVGGDCCFGKRGQAR